MNGTPAEKRDGVAITGEPTVTVKAEEDAELVLVDAREITQFACFSLPVACRSSSLCLKCWRLDGKAAESPRRTQARPAR